MSTRKIKMWVIVWEIAENSLMVDAGELLSNNKTQIIVNARRIAVALCYQYGNKVYDIARYFNISYSHVFTCIKRQKELNQLYPADNKLYKECERRCLDAK